jgi:hypothetical protein
MRSLIKIKSSKFLKSQRKRNQGLVIKVKEFLSDKQMQRDLRFIENLKLENQA